MYLKQSVTLPKIQLNNLYNLNEIIHEYSRDKNLGNKLKQSSTGFVSVLIKSWMNEHWYTKEDFKDFFPGDFIFEYHLSNVKRDNDNISGGARKSILDGLQKSGLLANDSHLGVRHIVEFFKYDIEKLEDEYVVLKIVKVNEDDDIIFMRKSTFKASKSKDNRKVIQKNI